MEECHCVKPSHFGSKCKYIPAATSKQGAFELFFASRHAPPQAATEPLNFVMLEFQLTENFFLNLFSEEKIVLNKRYEPPALRLTADSIHFNRDMRFHWDIYHLEPLGVDKWAKMALRFRPFQEKGTCVQCQHETSIWQSTSSPWYCGSCWNEWARQCAEKAA